MTELVSDIQLTVNGKEVKKTVPVRRHLVDFLRLDMNLTGSHLACEHGVCGACTVRVDGASVRGCLMLAVQADGCDVTTIEGLSETGEVSDLQEQLEERNGAQCGYCTPGMIMSAADLMSCGQIPSRMEIREHLSGNLCRCTGYQAIVDAVEYTIRKRLEDKGSGG